MKNTKFRAWDKKENKWVDYPIYIDGEGNIYWENYERGLQEDNDLIVMQSTGLVDKHGFEIYEGDIIEFVPLETSINNRVVKFEKGVFKAELIRNGYSVTLSNFQESEIKVIGNIYQNNDLLEG